MPQHTTPGACAPSTCSPIDRTWRPLRPQTVCCAPTRPTARWRCSARRHWTGSVTAPALLRDTWRRCARALAIAPIRRTAPRGCSRSKATRCGRSRGSTVRSARGPTAGDRSRATPRGNAIVRCRTSGRSSRRRPPGGRAARRGGGTTSHFSWRKSSDLTRTPPAPPSRRRSTHRWHASPATSVHGRTSESRSSASAWWHCCTAGTGMPFPPHPSARCRSTCTGSPTACSWSAPACPRSVGRASSHSAACRWTRSSHAFARSCRSTTR